MAKERTTSWRENGAYRAPIPPCPTGTFPMPPIVRYRSPGALVLQVLLQPAIVYLGWAGGSSTAFVLACAIGTTGLIWYATQRRGMAEASLAWRAATVVMLLFFLAISVIALLA